MPRSVNAVASRAKRKKTMKLAKGYFGRRKNVWTVAKNAVEKGLLYAYEGRKQKKRTFRALWIQRINAGVRPHGMSYSQFMGQVNAKGIQLNPNSSIPPKYPMTGGGIFDEKIKIELDEKINYFLQEISKKNGAFIGRPFPENFDEAIIK